MKIWRHKSLKYNNLSYLFYLEEGSKRIPAMLKLPLALFRNYPLK